MNTRPQVVRHPIRALPPGHQQVKLLENPIDRAGVIVIPGDHTLGRVASADHIDFRPGPRSPNLSRDIDEQTAVDNFDAGFAQGMFAPGLPTNPAEHLNPLVDARAAVFLVRQRSWNREDDLVDVSAGSLRERDMSASYRVEGSRDDADPLRAHRRLFSRNGSTYWITCRFASIAPA